jgi:formylglycine-generating enzyme required for sulfatase activity
MRVRAVIFTRHCKYGLCWVWMLLLSMLSFACGATTEDGASRPSRGLHVPADTPQSDRAPTPRPVEESSVGRSQSSPRAPGEGEWVLIKAGTFTMGSPVTELGRYTHETQHEVTLTRDFYMQSTEVTQADFEALIGYNPSDFSLCGDDCPVETVNWHEAAAYCNAQSLDAGHEECYVCTGSGTSVNCSPAAEYASPYDCPGYRLPTEAEWEYAARAGTTTGTYNGDPDVTDCSASAVLEPIAWYCGNSGDKTHAVGGKLANAWGLYDMLGNVWEWTSDWYQTDLGSGAVTDPWGSMAGSLRVLRGGSWGYYARYARAAYRDRNLPDGRSHLIGFRPVRSRP